MLVKGLEESIPHKLFMGYWNNGPNGRLSPGDNTRLILGLCPANERRRYYVTVSVIGWAQA